MPPTKKKRGRRGEGLKPFGTLALNEDMEAVIRTAARLRGLEPMVFVRMAAMELARRDVRELGDPSKEETE